MLHTLQGGYIVGILIGATLFQGIAIHPLKGTFISVSFEIYGYSPVRPIGSTKVNNSYLESEMVKGVKNIYILESKQIQKQLNAALENPMDKLPIWKVVCQNGK